MKTFNFFFLISFLITLLGCHLNKTSENQERKETDILSNCPVVGNYKIIGNDSVLICDFQKMKERIDLPLSDLLSSYQIIRLDTARNGLCAPRWATAKASQQYIIVKTLKDPMRLFDRKTGKFLRQIGNKGQGPEEYVDAYDAQIDEKHNAVLIYASEPSRIIQYELSTGKYQKEYKLIYDSAQQFYCNLDENEIIGMGFPHPMYAEGSNYFWKQSLDSKLIQGITGIEQVGYNWHNRGGGHLDDRSNSFYVSLWDTTEIKPDTLYHYNLKENRLQPRFTIEWGKKIPPHSYIEFPGYYYCEMADENKTQLLVDKHTGRGAIIRLKLDMFGKDLDFKTLLVHHYDSYGLSFLFDPLQLADILKEEEQQKTIAGRIMNPDSLQNENSWVFIGNWK